MAIEVLINEEARSVRADCSLSALLEELSLKHQLGIVVALNSRVIRKDVWNETKLKSGDKLLLFTASQGG